MEHFCNLTALLSIDDTAYTCFAALPSSIQSILSDHNAQLHTREDLLLSAIKLLLPVQ